MRFTPVERSVTSTFELWSLSVTLSPAIQNYHVESDWYSTTLAGAKRFAVDSDMWQRGMSAAAIPVTLSPKESVCISAI